MLDIFCAHCFIHSCILFCTPEIISCDVCCSQARSQTFLWGGQIGQILGPFMITGGLSCDHVEFGHFGGGGGGGGGQMTPMTPPGYGPGSIIQFHNHLLHRVSVVCKS